MKVPAGGRVITVIYKTNSLEHELCIRPKHLSSPTDFCGIRAAQSLVICVVFCGISIKGA
jgi:hypothetical protein